MSTTRRNSPDYVLSLITQVKIATACGVQADYQPFFCELKSTNGVHNLTFIADDGSGDKEIRSFTISSPQVGIMSKGPRYVLHVTTRNDRHIKMMFPAIETAKIWASALQGDRQPSFM